MATRYLVLFNGGLKSTFLADLARREGEAILCYCILTEEDSERLSRIAKLSDIFALQMVVEDLRRAPPLKETLLRMLYLVLNALPLAKSNYCNYIYHGLSRDDDWSIVKVMDAYVKQLNSLIELGQPLYNRKGHWLGQVSLETPLRQLDRARVIRLGNEYSTPWELTNSCNSYGHNVHCGKCEACIRRRRAFLKEGHDDPTPYLE